MIEIEKAVMTPDTWGSFGSKHKTTLKITSFDWKISKYEISLKSPRVEKLTRN